MFDIVIPLYNKERFIGATLEFVLAQTYKEWRLFIVDDGSGDEGPVIVERYHDERIQLMRQANQGVGLARNRAMRQGSADWIALLDADDIWNVDHLEELDAIRQAFPQTVLIGCGYARLKGDALPRSRRSGRGRRRLSRYFAELAHGRQPFITSSVAVRRSAIAEVGEFKALPGNEDVELWARLALHGPVASSTKSTVHYRIDTGGITDLENRKCPTSTQALRREDLSSTIPTLASRLPDIQDLELRHDIVEYIDFPDRPVPSEGRPSGSAGAGARPPWPLRQQAHWKSASGSRNHKASRPDCENGRSGGAAAQGHSQGGLGLLAISVRAPRHHSVLDFGR